MDRKVYYTITLVFRVLIHKSDVEYAWVEPNNLFDVYEV